MSHIGEIQSFFSPAQELSRKALYEKAESQGWKIIDGEKLEGQQDRQRLIFLTGVLALYTLLLVSITIFAHVKHLGVGVVTSLSLLSVVTGGFAFGTAAITKYFKNKSREREEEILHLADTKTWEMHAESRRIFV